MDLDNHSPDIDCKTSLLKGSLRRRKANIKWFCFILGVVLLFFRKDIVQSFPTPVIILGVPLVLGSLAIILFRTARLSGDNPFLVPSSSIFLFYTITYGLGTSIVYYYDIFPWEAIPGNASTFLRVKLILPETAPLLLVGGLGLIIGTLLSPQPLRTFLPAITYMENRTVFRTNLFILIPLIVITTVLSIQQKSPVLVGHFITLIDNFGFFVLIIAGAEIATNPQTGIRQWGLYILVMIALAIIIGTPTGMRGHSLRPFILLTIGVVVLYRRIPGWLWGSLPILVVIVMPWLNFVKENAGQGAGLVNLMASATAHVGGMSFREQVEDGIQVFGSRIFYYPHQLAMYMKLWPEIYPFEYGKTFMIELAHILPRILFPWKGNISGQLNWYAVQAGIIAEPDPETGAWTSAVFDGMSEYYINFGPWGLFLLAIFNGYYFSVLYDWMVVRSRSFFFTAIYAYLIWFTWPDAGIIRRILSDSRILAMWVALFIIMNWRPGTGQHVKATFFIKQA